MFIKRNGKKKKNTQSTEYAEVIPCTLRWDATLTKEKLSQKLLLRNIAHVHSIKTGVKKKHHWHLFLACFIWSIC